MPRQTPLERPPQPAQLLRSERSGAAFADAVNNARKEAGPDAMAVVWVSDVHLHARRPYDEDLCFYATHVDSSLNFRLALAEIRQIQADLIVFGGDVADSGCFGETPADEYDDFERILGEMLPANVPSLLVLGNHDHADQPLSNAYRTALKRIARADWPDAVEPDDHYYAVKRGGWRFITLDARQTHALSEKQRAWLAAQLKADGGTPTVVLVHRPFVSVGNWVDNHRLADRRSFDVIDGAACVKAVLSGHTHRAQTWKYRNKIHSVFPAAAYGIGHACGWGCVVLAKDRVHCVYVKELAGEFFEHVAYKTADQQGGFQRMPFALFEDSPLCDPCVLPRRNESETRD